MLQLSHTPAALPPALHAFEVRVWAGSDCRPECSRPSVAFPSSLSSPFLLLLSFRVSSLPATEYVRSAAVGLVVTPPSHPPTWQMAH
jgi:hypothetical protein